MSYVKFKVKTEKLNVRAVPSRAGKIVQRLKKGQIINVVSGSLKVVDGVKWYKAKIGNHHYWINAKLVSRTKESYRSLVLKKAKMIYGLVIKLGCKHKGGAKTLDQMKSKKITTCASSVSIALQEAGVLKKGKLVSHTRRVGSSVAVKKKNTIGKAISGTSHLIDGTYKIIKIGKRYKNMPAKYKKPGNVLVYDSNIAIIRDKDSMYSCNDGRSQKDGQGHYKHNIVNSNGNNYCTQSPVLYVIQIL